MTYMVKVFGRRSTQAAGLGKGRRTKTAHIRTRGVRTVLYGDLRIPERQRLHEAHRGGLQMFDLPWAEGASSARCWYGNRALGSRIRPSGGLELGMRVQKTVSRSNMASTEGRCWLCRVTTASSRIVGAEPAVRGPGQPLGRSR